MVNEWEFRQSEDYWKLNQGESFWEDALEHFLRARLQRVYLNKKYKKRFLKWLEGNSAKVAIIHLTDIPSDPFVIKLMRDEFEAKTVQTIDFSPDLELTTDHISLMSFGYNPWYLIPLVMFKMLTVKAKTFRDRWMFLRLILM